MALLWWHKAVFSYPFTFASISLAILLNLVFFMMKKSRSSCKLPPSPPKFPIIGNLHHLGSKPHESLQNLANKYGLIMSLQLGQVPTLVISSARLAKEALKTYDLVLTSRPRLFSAKHLFYNCTDIAFSPYGAYWRNIRKICILGLFSAKRVLSFSFVREEEVAKLVLHIAESFPSTTNLTSALERYANNIICRVAFGKDFSQGKGNVQHSFQKLLAEYQILLGGFSIGDFFPSLEFIHKLTGMEARLKDTFTRFDLFFDGILKEHRNPDNRKQHKDLVDVLLNVQREDGAATYLTDTNFFTLDWVMTELMVNGDALKRAQAEVRGIVGEKRTVSEKDLPRLHYMKAVVKETFRLNPPAPLLIPRESMEDLNIDGYSIPAKTRYFINAWAIGRDPETWENPNIFYPERFISSQIDFKGQDFELLPFGAGRRICPGITFSTATVEFSLAQLLHSFEWELPPGVQAKDLDMAEDFGITMHKTTPLVVIAKPHFQGALM